jgi:hypothetical protein
MTTDDQSAFARARTIREHLVNARTHYEAALAIAREMEDDNPRMDGLQRLHWPVQQQAACIVLCLAGDGDYSAGGWRKSESVIEEADNLLEFEGCYPRFIRPDQSIATGADVQRTGRVISLSGAMVAAPSLR